MATQTPNIDAIIGELAADRLRLVAQIDYADRVMSTGTDPDSMYTSPMFSSPDLVEVREDLVDCRAELARVNDEMREFNELRNLTPPPPVHRDDESES